jgi:hypothetical protein
MSARALLTEKQLLARDAKRNIGAELLLSVRQTTAGKGKLVARAEVPGISELPCRNCNENEPSS